MFKQLENVWESESITRAESADSFARTQLMLILRDMFYQRGWTQKETAKHLGIKQPRVSALINGKVKDFSVGMLFGYLFKLGWEVDFKYDNNEVTAEAKKVA